MELVQGTREHLASYVAALRSGWSGDNIRGEAAAREELEQIEADPDAFLASLYDPDAKGGPIRMPDGSTAQRLPGFRRWMWDGEFCGSIGFRWAPGTEELPAHVLGHVGYSVVPWKQRRGDATQAVRAIQPVARARGLRYLTITTDPDNVASQRVIVAAGGVLMGRFMKAPQFGGHEGLWFRIEL
jgi:predicted acetyltransferase